MVTLFFDFMGQALRFDTVCFRRQTGVKDSDTLA